MEKLACMLFMGLTLGLVPLASGVYYVLTKSFPSGVPLDPIIWIVAGSFVLGWASGVMVVSKNG